MEEGFSFCQYGVFIQIFHVLEFAFYLGGLSNSHINKNFACFFYIFDVFNKILIYVEVSFFSFLNPLLAIPISIISDEACFL